MSKRRKAVTVNDHGYPVVTVYTDGSCRTDTKAGGWAAVLICGSHEQELSGRADNTTNNRMELTAVIQALKSLDATCEVHLFTDSKYVITGTIYARKWKKAGWRNWKFEEVANTDLWDEYLTEAARHIIKTKWVKGHVGIEHNERCDKLAKAARDNKSLAA